MTFSNAEILKEVKRELAMRRKFYPIWVSEGRMTKNLADHRIAIFQQMQSEYQERVEQEDNDLFADQDVDGGVFDPGTVGP